MRRFRDSVTITVPLPAGEAMPLFTARGERRWVEEWDPEFPAGEPSEEDPGTVWITAAGDRSTYDLTALTEEGAAELDEFAEGFREEIGSWEDLIRRLVSS